MAKVDITRTNDAVSRLLEVTESPRHRFMLLTYYRHRFRVRRSRNRPDRRTTYLPAQLHGEAEVTLFGELLRLRGRGSGARQSRRSSRRAVRRR
jgi:hypothetical protein